MDQRSLERRGGGWARGVGHVGADSGANQGAVGVQIGGLVKTPALQRNKIVVREKFALRRLLGIEPQHLWQWVVDEGDGTSEPHVSEELATGVTRAAFLALLLASTVVCEKRGA